MSLDAPGWGINDRLSTGRDDMGFKDKLKAGMAADKARADRGKELQAMFTGAEKLNPIKYQFAQQAAARVLEDDEEVLRVFAGEYDAEDANAILCVTDRRVIIGWSKKGAPGSMTMRYENIDEVHSGYSYKGAWITLQHGSHAYKVEKSMSNENKALDIEKIIRAKQEEFQAGRASATTVVQQSSSMDELAKAAELHKAGVLNDEEFAAMKAKVLGL